jgi:type I restriction enzyme M protein
VLETYRAACRAAKDEPMAALTDRLLEAFGTAQHTDYNAFSDHAEALATRYGVRMSAARHKLFRTLAQRDETAAPIIKKIYKTGKEADPLHGLFPAEANGKPCVVEYEPDPDLRDTEQIPLLEEGGIAAYIAREVHPHVPDAWIDESSAKVGYEISFNRYFYKPQPLRTLDEIRADLLALEQETDGLLRQILGLGSGK